MLEDETQDVVQDLVNDIDGDLSIELTTSYGSLNNSAQYGTYDNSIYSNSKYSQSRSFYSVVGDEKSPLVGPKLRTNTMGQSRHYISYTSSLANATQSISKLTTSNYFGFSSSAYAAARYKDVECSKTISLLDVASLDRFTPSTVSFFTLLSLLTGLSIFVFPLLVAHCGLWMLPLIIVIGLITWYTTFLINKCQYQITKVGTKKRVYKNYIDLGKASIKWHGETLMKILVASSVFTDIYSLIFCAQISTDLLSKYIKLDPRIWMVIWVGLVFPLFFIRRMSALAWFGFCALVLYVVGLCFVFALLIWHHDIWEWQNINPTFSVQYLFVGFGVIMNTFNIHLAAPAVEASMRDPKHFNRVTSAAFITNILIKVFLAVVGAAAFGLSTKGSLLTNLVQFGVYASVVNVMIGLYMYTQYPTSMFVVFEMMDIYILPKFKLFKAGEKSEAAWLILSRLTMSIFIAFVAVSLPNFEMLTSFIGNIRGTLTTITLPIYFYLKIHSRSISTCSKIIHWLMIVIATILSLIGAGFSLYGMF